MALKIEFAAEFKDAERIQKILNELNDQMTKLAAAGGSVGQAATSGFTQLSSALKGFDDATKGLKSIQDISESIKSLSKLQGDVGTIDKMFSDVGRSISKNIGAEKADNIQKLRDQIRGLREDSEKAKQIMQEAEYNYKMAETRGDEAGMKFFKQRGQSAAVYAQKSSREADRGDEELDELGNPINQARDWMKNSKFMKTAGRFGGYAAAALAGVQAADDLFNVAPERAFAAEQRYSTAASREAQQGDITRAMLRAGNVGSGASSRLLDGNDGLGQAGTVASVALQTVMSNTIGNLINLISGKQVEFKGPTQLYHENLMGKESVDREAYGLAMGAAGQQQMKRMNMFADIERFGGSRQMQAALTGLSGRGVTMDMAAPMAQSLYEAGSMISESDVNLVYGQNRLGFGQNYGNMLARQRFMKGSGGAESMMYGDFEGAGLTGREAGRARGVFGEAISTIRAGTAGYDMSGMGSGLTAMVGQGVSMAGASGISMEDATRSAASVYGAAQGTFAPGGIYSGIEMASMARMGITNPMVQQYVQSMLKKDPAAADAMIKKLTGGKGSMAALQKDVGGMADTFAAPLFDENDPQVAAIGKNNLQAYAMMGDEATFNKGIQNQFSKGLGGALTTARYSGKKEREYGPSALDQTMGDMSDKETVQTAQAGQERAIYDAAQRLEQAFGRSIVSTIADGFSKMGEDIRKSMDKVQSDKGSSDQRTKRINEQNDMVSKATKTMTDPNSGILDRMGAAAMINSSMGYGGPGF